MNFNSVVFLFCFMPLALGLYYLVPGRVKNAVLLVESLLFFCRGGSGSGAKAKPRYGQRFAASALFCARRMW